MKYCKNHLNRKVFSRGLCIECYKKDNPYKFKRIPLKKKLYTIKPIANKRAKQLRTYYPLKKKFLKENPLCQIKGQHCTLIATEVHHSEGRENELLLDVSKFVATCHNCHTGITKDSKEAIEKGHSISRIKK